MTVVLRGRRVVAYTPFGHPSHFVPLGGCHDADRSSPQQPRSRGVSPPGIASLAIGVALVLAVGHARLGPAMGTTSSNWLSKPPRAWTPTSTVGLWTCRCSHGPRSCGARPRRHRPARSIGRSWMRSIRNRSRPRLPRPSRPSSTMRRPSTSPTWWHTTAFIASYCSLTTWADWSPPRVCRVTTIRQTRIGGRRRAATVAAARSA